MKTEQPTVRPLISREEMNRILSARRSITSEEAYLQIERHLGRPLEPAKKLVSQNGQEIWVLS